MDTTPTLRGSPVVSCLPALASPVVAALLVAACGGAGPPVQGPAARALFDEYSATWMLDTLASEKVPDMEDLPERRTPVGGQFGGGGLPEGGRPGGGLRPPGGIGGRPGGGMRGPGGFRGPDPRSIEAMHHLMEKARQRPDRITLALDDSLFSADLHREVRVIVPIGGEGIELSGLPSPVTARLEWDGLRPRLERRFEGGGTIVDLFEVVDRTKLLVMRTIELERGKDLRLVFVYRREGRGTSAESSRGPEAA